MKSRIRLHYPSSTITSRVSNSFYVADFSERTKSARKVEIHHLIPACPLNPENTMDCIEIKNENSLSIDFNIFDDCQFHVDGKDIEHCEGCFYPTTNHDRSWIAMMEIKDCKPKNIRDYKDKAIDQIVASTTIYRSKNIITSHRVYGIISMPRCKVSFNNTIFGMPPKYKELKKAHNILFAATNQIIIINDIKLKCKE